MPNWLRQKRILKQARIRAFEEVLNFKGLNMSPEEALNSNDLDLVAAAAWVVPPKLLQDIVDHMGLDTHDDRLDLILFIEKSRGCPGCNTGHRRCLSCERALTLYGDLGLAVPQHLT